MFAIAGGESQFGVFFTIQDVQNAKQIEIFFASDGEWGRQHGAFTSSESTQSFKIYEPKGFTKENITKNTFIAHPFTHTLIYYWAY